MTNSLFIPLYVICLFVSRFQGLFILLIIVGASFMHKSY
ncbi:YjcZ family sporulation protein [Lysinibacillus sp. NPDC096418]